MQKFLAVMMLFFLMGNTEADRTYHSNFPKTENPISENGNWINGGTAGLDWSTF